MSHCVVVVGHELGVTIKPIKGNNESSLPNSNVCYTIDRLAMALYGINLLLDAMLIYFNIVRKT